jgi:hypothetical protein
MTHNSRDIIDVINRILEVIPTTETLLINELQEYRDSLWNKAPEIRTTRDGFLPVQKILSKHILLLDNDWKLQVLHIFNIY